MARPKAVRTLPEGLEPWVGPKVGLVPYTVQPLELEERGFRVYLRWRARGNWRKRAVRDGAGHPLTLRTADGKLVKSRLEQATAAAKAWYETLVTSAGGGPPAATPSVGAVAAGLTFAAGQALAFDPATGKYPTRSDHRDEVQRELVRVAHVLGALAAPLAPVLTWEAVQNKHLRALWRARIRELHGHGRHGLRGAEVTLARFLAVARWLRDEEHLPPHACVAPRDWKAQLKRDWIEITAAHEDPTPARPRYTVAEMRRIHRAARDSDPRMRLLLAIGAEQRLGQVLRARRGALDLARATFRVPSYGKKRGALLALTEGQLQALHDALDPRAGYLGPWEGTQTDYPLFPGGSLRRGQVHADLLALAPMSREQARAYFLATEAAAQVPHERGRGWYGIRRVAVDAAQDEGISPGGLEAHGGWTNAKTPNEIYRERERVGHRREARDVRARIRGETAVAREGPLSARADAVIEAVSGVDAPAPTAGENDDSRTHDVHENANGRPEGDGHSGPFHEETVTV